MNLLRRTAAVAGVLIGLTGTLACVTPANAAPVMPWATLTAVTYCSVGTSWGVTWKLNTHATRNVDGVISDVEENLTPAVLDQPAGAGILVSGGKVRGDGEFQQGQSFERPATAVHLTFKLTWASKISTDSTVMSADATAPGPCPPGKPLPTPTATPPTSPAPQPTASASASTPPLLAAPADTSGTAGGLPVTGAAAVTIAGVAGTLLAMGAVLFVVARRRRVTFTA